MIKSNIGFGTAGLVGAGSNRKQFELLSEAFDLGIRHFDTAPYYGYGQAERALGKFIRTKRDQVTITTKFGIQPMAGLGSMGSLVGLVRRCAKLVPPLQRLLASQARKAVRHNVFSVADAEKSLETSLSALQTDYVDFFLLHEPSVEHLTDELLVFLKDAVTRGKVKRFGVSGEFSQILSVPAAQRDYSSVLQFENSVMVQNRRKIPAADPSLIITYRALHQTFTRLHQDLVRSNKAGQWSDALGLDCSKAEELSGLLFAWACADNPKGIVLFSTSNTGHLRRNAESASGGRFSIEQFRVLEKLLSVATL